MAAAVQGWPGGVLGMVPQVERHLGPKDVVRPLRRLVVGKPSVRWQLVETTAYGAVELAVVLGRGDRRSIGDLVAGTQVVEAR